MLRFVASLLILLSPALRAELSESETESNVEGISVKHVYRGTHKILEIASPAKDAPSSHVNATYTIIADNLPLYKYQVSKRGASFQRVNFVDMRHTVKMHSNHSGMIEQIFVYTADFKSTIDAFHVKDRQLVPFSDGELAKHRLIRNESSITKPRFWNYLRVRGSAEIDVALFNYGQPLKVRGKGMLRGFEVAGNDRKFKPAKAKISHQITKAGELNVTWINLKSAQVKAPVYIRYAQGEYQSQANLVNASGEEAIPFQTHAQEAASKE